MALTEKLATALPRAPSGKRPDMRGNGTEVSWDVCEIALRVTSGADDAADMFFDAIAVGPHGKYRVAKSQLFPYEATNVERSLNARGGLAALTRRLAETGWQPLPPGRAWFSQRFRRLSRASL